MKHVPLIFLLLVVLGSSLGFAEDLDSVDFDLSLRKQGETAIYFYETDYKTPVAAFDFGQISGTGDTRSIGVYYAVYPSNYGISISSLNIYFLPFTATGDTWQSSDSFMFSWDDGKSIPSEDNGLNVNVSYSGDENNTTSSLTFASDEIDEKMSLDRRTLKLISTPTSVGEKGYTSGDLARLTFTINAPNGQSQLAAGRYSGYVLIELKTDGS